MINQRATKGVLWLSFCALMLSSCELLKFKKGLGSDDSSRKPVARVKDAYLYKDELRGVIAPGTSTQDSASRVEAYIDSWIRKQLLIQEAARKININEAEVERKILDYRYSIIAYEYQTYYIKQNLDTAVVFNEIENYYKQNRDNFILKQNIVQATFIKVPKSAPQTDKIKAMLYSASDKDRRELKSYCLSFSAAYHISDSTWIVFDDLVRNSPIAEIPNKIEFLKSNPYYQTADDHYLYFLKVDRYKISDNVSPLEFVKDDIKNIILNKRKVSLVKRLEDEVYNRAESAKGFEIYN
jgi:hypothetical protein